MEQDQDPSPVVVPLTRSESFDEIYKISGLSPANIMMIKAWIDRAEEQSKAYMKKSYIFHCADKNLKLANLVLAGFLGGSSIMGLFQVSSEDAGYHIMMISAVLSVSMLVTQSLIKVLEPEKTWHNARIAAREYRNFSRETRARLVNGLAAPTEGEVVSSIENAISEVELNVGPI